MQAALKTIRGHSFWDRFGPAPAVVDLGANVGRFAAEFLAAYPGSEMVLVEADPYLTGILERSFAGLGRVRLYRGLVGRHSMPRASFHLCRVPEGNSIHRRFSEVWAPGESRQIWVEMISLRDLLGRAELRRVDLLKVDIEGSEWDVLEELGPAEASFIDQISVEFHDFLDPGLRPRTEACIDHLSRMGYRVLARGTDRVHGSPYFDCLFYREASHTLPAGG